MPTSPSERRVVHRGRKIEVILETGRSQDGREYQRDIVVHPGAVAILPWVDDRHICLVRNVRPIVGETLLEIPAGTLEKGEDPARAAHRELAEETGFRASAMEKLLEFYPSPGVLTEKTHVYIARELQPGDMKLEADEDLQPCIVPWDDAHRWALDGTIRDAKTIVAILVAAGRCQ